LALLNKQTIKTLTTLSRISCSEEEQEALLADLQKILTYIDQLDEVDTENTPPCNQVISDMANVMREDEAGETLLREVFLANAPSQIGGLIRVPPVLKSK
jgi:aspartyl-tRNA(Asn)/glutamyl-tRNA(Gln) amidotransferase subunit C